MPVATHKCLMLWSLNMSFKSILVMKSLIAFFTIKISFKNPLYVTLVTWSLLLSPRNKVAFSKNFPDTCYATDIFDRAIPEGLEQVCCTKFHWRFSIRRHGSYIVKLELSSADRDLQGMSLAVIWEHWRDSSNGTPFTHFRNSACHTVYLYTVIIYGIIVTILIQAVINRHETR